MIAPGLLAGPMAAMATIGSSPGAPQAVHRGCECGPPSARANTCGVSNSRCLDCSTKFQWIGYLLERFFGPAGADHDDRAVT